MSTTNDTARRKLEAAIAALEAQRETLGDEVTDTALAPLEEKLAALERSETEAHDAPAESAAPTDQRKQITVLFADVSGFTAMSETMDAEEVHGVMNALWERLDGAIVEHGGRVDKHIGDAVMALFGAPVAREHDPEHAVRAALAMQAAVQQFNDAQPELRASGTELAVRVGIHTGWVLVGEVGTTAEYTAMGDTVNLASRLEGAAPVGGVLISHGTYRQVRGRFELEAREPISVKGKREPVRTYRVTGLRPRTFQAPGRGVEGAASPMIGREAELARLIEVVRSVRGRRTHTAAVTADDAQPTGSKAHVSDAPRAIVALGDAGVGKSRLLYELERLIQRRPDPPMLLKARADPQTRSVPYTLVRDAIMRHCGASDSDAADAALDQLHRCMTDALGASSADAVSLVAHLLGLEDAPEPPAAEGAEGARQAHERARHELTRFLGAVGETGGGALLLLEDLHWADNASLDLVAHLAAPEGPTALRVIGTARPSLRQRRPAWSDPEPGIELLPLAPLSDADSRQLVEALLQKVTDLPTRLSDLVVERAEGNPFFVEELVAILIEDEVVVPAADGWRVTTADPDRIQIPPTLTGVLQARLDRLPARQRTILQQAAVIGRVFWAEAVAALSRDEAVGPGPFPSPRHVADERGVDGATAAPGPDLDPAPQATPSASASDVDPDVEIPAALAADLRAVQNADLVLANATSSYDGCHEYQFKHALLRDVAYESVLLRDRRRHHRQLAAWLLARSANRMGEVAGQLAYHLERAEDRAAVAWHRRAGDHAFDAFANQDALSHYDRALALLEELTDEADWAEHPADDGRLSALRRRYELYRRREAVLDRLGRRADQAAALEHMSGLADALGEQECGEVLLREANLAWSTDDFSGAERAATRALELARASEDRITEGAALRQLGRVARETGDYDAAVEHLEAAAERFAAAGHDGQRANTLIQIGVLHSERGALGPALAYLEEGQALARDEGRTADHAWALDNLSVVHAMDGRLGAALASGREALELARRVGSTFRETRNRINLSVILSGLGDDEAALEMATAALELSRTARDPSGTALAQINRGTLYRRLGRHVQALTALEAGLAGARDHQRPYLETAALTALGETYLARDGADDPARAERAARDARETAQRVGLEGYAILAAGCLARALVRQGFVDDAVRLSKQAVATLEAGGSAEGEEERVYYSHYRVLAAAGLDGAEDALRQARDIVTRKAEAIQDPQLRRSFRTRVPLNREILETGEGDP